ncbi:class I SAM-dependent methyltransferase (plasmid) [Pseudoalteromonas xiamenensis]|uniref:class I SAM-dependent methyltransferase n=1 Tax=Pseudoalteromonas xiamenensis TaxID=882626 RepID=UPI0027E46A21|nr:methyltransferase domain-containing protein [Pseudoalteromonas xiamenensis]WMN61563.1 class I SAM-dependent methyltransferase [Pseudoalteromonas xiamenensis]WMN62271.1 class I SAM-dependent methyltransferase [Pseudoalteromonas xiamenensis]
MSQDYYNIHAYDLANQYQAVDFEYLHAHWLHLLKPYLRKAQARFLDVGAGAGRDAVYFALNGNDPYVVAVEPATTLKRMGEAYSGSLPILWLEDSLPRMFFTEQLGIQFDVILLSSVLNHLPIWALRPSLYRVTQLLLQGGIIVISLRESQDVQDNEQRGVTNIAIEQLLHAARCEGLSCIYQKEAQADFFGRDAIKWHVFVFQVQ